jgi:hypothetical protein
MEYGNGVFKKKLVTWREQNNTTEFVHALPHLALAMNKQPHSSLPNRMCPYEVIFGRKPRQEHRVPSHLRQLSQVQEQSISDSESQSEEGGTRDSIDTSVYGTPGGFDSDDVGRVWEGLSQTFSQNTN